jgi:hypothetical protein
MFALYSPVFPRRQLRAIPDRVSQLLRENIIRGVDARLAFHFPGKQTGEVTMRRDELMKPDFLSEFLLLVSGAVLFFVLILSGIAALIGK